MEQKSEITPPVSTSDAQTVLKTDPLWKPFLIPGSIVLAGLLISVSVLVSATLGGSATGTVLGADNNAARIQTLAKNVAPLQPYDHDSGSASAKVILIEFSDLDCPYCLQFHPVLKRLSAEYSGEEFAWVYRHYPLTSIHPTAQMKAEATECVSEQGGETTFWTFVDALFDNPGATETQLTSLAVRSGAPDEKAFKECLASGKYGSRVQNQLNDGIGAGVTGTPHSILISGNQYFAFQGSESYNKIKAKIDEFLSK